MLKLYELYNRYDFLQCLDLWEDFVYSIRDGGWKEIFRSDGFLVCSRDILFHVMKSFHPWNPVDTCWKIEKSLDWAKNECERNGIDASIPANWRLQLDECFDLKDFEDFNIELFLKFEKAYPVFTMDEFRSIVNHITVEKNNSRKRSRSSSTSDETDCE